MAIIIYELNENTLRKFNTDSFLRIKILSRERLNNDEIRYFKENYSDQFFSFIILCNSIISIYNLIPIVSRSSNSIILNVRSKEFPLFMLD
jgi:hypothetical protein